MQLKHKGNTIHVTLTVNETKLLTKAADLLMAVAMVPCEKRAEATEMAGKLCEIAKAIGKE